MIKNIPEKIQKTLFNQKLKREVLAAYQSLNQPPSVIFFTTHKCASTFVAPLLKTITDHSDYQVKNYASAIWSLGNRVDLGSSYEDFLEKAYDRLYKTKGEIYAPQRRPLDFLGREKFKHIFFWRDPRDVLVSAYYSFGYNHSLPKGKKHQQDFSEGRKKIKGQGIDDYAKEAAVSWLMPIYEKYQEILETSSSYIYLSYDEFKDDTWEFIHKMANFLEVDIPDEQAEKLVQKASPVQTNKQLKQHKRSGKSKQYLEELQPETVQFLNQTFADSLFYWNFKD